MLVVGLEQRRATDSTAEKSLLQPFELLRQEDGFERLCHLDQVFLILGRQDTLEEQPAHKGVFSES
jgi:hypothetical protein